MNRSLFTFMVLILGQIGLSGCTGKTDPVAPPVNTATTETGADSPDDSNSEDGMEPGPTATPAVDPTPTPPESIAWQRLQYDRNTDAIDANCVGPSGYFLGLERNGTFLARGCYGVLTGALTAAERVDMEARVQSVAVSGVLDQLCDDDFLPYAPISVSVTFAPGQRVDVYRADARRGECTRGGKENVIGLRDALERIKANHPIPKLLPVIDPAVTSGIEANGSARVLVTLHTDVDASDGLSRAEIRRIRERQEDFLDLMPDGGISGVLIFEREAKVAGELNAEGLEELREIVLAKRVDFESERAIPTPTPNPSPTPNPTPAPPLSPAPSR